MQNVVNPPGSPEQPSTTVPITSGSTEPLRPPTGTLVPRTEPTGFGFSDQRRQDIFDSEPFPTNTAYPNYPKSASGGVGGVSSAQGPFTNFEGPFKRTFFLIEFTPEGIRVNIQATKKGFIIGALIIIALISLPNFSNTIQLLIKSILTG